MQLADQFLMNGSGTRSTTRRKLAERRLWVCASTDVKVLLAITPGSQMTLKSGTVPQLCADANIDTKNEVV